VRVSQRIASAGDTLTYTILLRNPGPALEGVTVTDALPAGLAYAGNASATTGTLQESGGVITWNGAVSSSGPVTIRFDAAISPSISSAQVIENMVIIEDGLGSSLQRSAVTTVKGYAEFPVCNKIDRCALRDIRR
jgi:uncharacterized repeat protein (TIGR01451 family)